jgi:hypothetical protein
MRPNNGITILRWGLAFVFFYAAIAALLDPQNWSQYVPTFVSAIIPTNLFLAGFSFYQLILAMFLFWGKKIFWSSLLATITLASIVVFDFTVIDIVFRDIGLAFASLALFEMSRYNNQR